MGNNFIKLLLLSGLSLSLTLGYAQKKSSTQATVWAATPYKIDGEINDWGDSLSSYNSASKLYYAISNDDKNLYVALKSTDVATIYRILSGGISFMVNSEGKKKSGPTITFPIISRSAIYPKNSNTVIEGQINKLSEMASKALQSAKEIQVEGIKAILDGKISIYNEYGIKVAASITNEKAYIYELAVPLKQLNLTSNSSEEIAFQIKVNGLEIPPSAFGGYGDRSMSGRSYGGGYPGRMDSSLGSLSQSTYFWIRQSLATK